MSLFTYCRAEDPKANGTYECLIHDFEGGPYLYTEPVEFKDGCWQDPAEVVAWRELSHISDEGKENQ